MNYNRLVTLLPIASV